MIVNRRSLARIDKAGAFDEGFSQGRDVFDAFVLNRDDSGLQSQSSIFVFYENLITSMR